MRYVQEAGLTDFEGQVKQAKLAFRHLGDIKVTIDSLLLKQNNKGSI